MSNDSQPNPQTLSDEALDQASGASGQAAPAAATPRAGDGSVIPGIIAVSGSPVNPGKTKGYEGWPC